MITHQPTLDTIQDCLTHASSILVLAMRGDKTSGYQHRSAYHLDASADAPAEDLMTTLFYTWFKRHPEVIPYVLSAVEQTLEAPDRPSEASDAASAKNN